MLLASGFAAATLLGPPAAADPRSTALEAAAVGLLSSAATELAAAPASRERMLFEAVLLLQTPPLTDAQLDRAGQMLRSVAQHHADEPALAARYYEGRLAQVHRREPRFDAARAAYRALWAEHPGSLWAQRALVQLLIVDLYGGDDFPDEATLAKFETAGERLTLAEARRDFHLVFADYHLAAARPARPADALRHLLAAEMAGSLSRQQQADTWMRIARVSEALGQPAQALTYYRRFTASVLRDNRLTLVRERIAALANPTSGR